MTRTYVVTGSASGIGRATVELLEERGSHVIGVDVREAEIVADLSTPAGRRDMVAGVAEASDGKVDGVIATASLSAPTPLTVAVNYFGALATLEGLRALLAESSAPRAVATASTAAFRPPDEALLEAMLTGDEDAALDRATVLAVRTVEMASRIYGTSAGALARWIRRAAPSAQWAGVGIPLNAIAPSAVATPMTADVTATDDEREVLQQVVPMPLGGIVEPRAVAYLLAWLAGEENAHLCGQVVFIDGGSDAVMRGDEAW